MRLMSFVYAAESTSRFGVIVDDSVIDLVEAARELAYPERSMPSNLTAFAAAGESVLATATEIMDRFRELSDDSSQVNFSWVYPVSGVRFLPPLLNPPKVIAVGLVLTVGGHWMLGQLIAFTNELFNSIPSLLAGG